MSIWDIEDKKRKKKDGIGVLILIGILGIGAAYLMFTCGFGDWIVQLAN